MFLLSSVFTKSYNRKEVLKLEEKKLNPSKKKLDLGFLRLIGQDNVDLDSKTEVQILQSCDDSCNCYSCDTCY